MGHGDNLSKENVNVGNWVLFAFAALSLVSTILNLIVIRFMGKWNGYLLIITCMALSQLVYDISFMMRVIPGYDNCLAWHFLGNIGGLGSSFWSNVLSITIVYTLIRIRSLDIGKAFPYFFLFATAFPVIFGICCIFALKHTDENDDGTRGYKYCTFKYDDLSSFINNFYYWGRIGSILFNFVAFVYSVFRLYRMGIYRIVSVVKDFHDEEFGTKFAPNPSGGKKQHRDPQHLALTVLISRMKYYPLAQTICRAGAALQEYNDYQYANNVSNFFAAILSPSLGILMFSIFLIMQPKAWRTFKSLLRGNWKLAAEENRVTPRNMKISVTEATAVLNLTEDELVDIINDKQFYFIQDVNPSVDFDSSRSRKISIGYLGSSSMYRASEFEDDNASRTSNEKHTGSRVSKDQNSRQSESSLVVQNNPIHN